MKKKIFLIAILLISLLLKSMSTIAQAPTLVKGGTSPSSNLVNVNGTVYFLQNDGSYGRGLWKSDGTEAGTVLVKKIQGGPIPSYSSSLANVNGTLYFAADNVTNGIELWKSDGTGVGTVLVKDLFTGTTSSSPQNLFNFNGQLYFTANDGIYGVELWKSDGTPTGTVLVKDISNGSGWSNPNYLTTVNGYLFFVAHNGINGIELWKSDGTPSGTLMVKDIYSGSFGSSPSYLTNVNGTLYFAANDGVHGGELWKSDGSSTGTVMVKNIMTGGLGWSSPTDLTNVNGTLFFAADDGINGKELWKSNGTSNSTVLVKDIAVGSYSSYTDGLVNFNGTLYFAASNDLKGKELWKSDGTQYGTSLVKDICPGYCWSSPRSLIIVNSTLLFVANNDVNLGGSQNFELWKSDGSESGTQLVKDIVTGSSGSFPRVFKDVNGILFFGVMYSDIYGPSIWKYAPCLATRSFSTISACNSYVWKGVTYTSGGYYFSDTIPNKAGCDSIMTKYVTINNLNVWNYSPTFIASFALAYQWVNCTNNYSPINGATSYLFTATINGSYAVIVSQNNCSDTSACFTVNNVITKHRDSEYIGTNVYPNPSKGNFSISIPQPQIATIFNMFGNELIVQQLDEGSNLLDISHYPKGVYFLNLKSESETKVIKLIKE